MKAKLIHHRQDADDRMKCKTCGAELEPEFSAEKYQCSNGCEDTLTFKQRVEAMYYEIKWFVVLVAVASVRGVRNHE